MEADEPIWLQGAEIDLQREFERQEDFRDGKGMELLEIVDAGNRLLASMPLAGPLYKAPYHRLVLRGSNYGMFYVPEDRGVVVHAFCFLGQSEELILRHLGISD